MDLPSDRRRSPRAKGYLAATLRTHDNATGFPAHVFEISRHGAYISTDAHLRTGEGIALDIVFADAAQYAPEAPELLSLPAHVVDHPVDESLHAEHYRVQFTDDTVHQNYAHIDALVRHRGFRMG
jgi:hypothetical protein